MSLRNHEQFVANLIEEWGGLDEIDVAIEAIEVYRETDFYESKNEILAQWEIDHTGIWEMVIAIFTASLTQEYLTLQAAVGMLNHKIKLDVELHRIKIIADVIGLVVNTGLVDMISTRGEYHVLSSSYDVEEDIPMADKHLTLTEQPAVVTSNYDRAGGTGSVILGHSMNHHTMDVRLSHLRRMGAIPFMVNGPLVEGYEESPKKDPDTETKQIQWEAFQEESLEKYEELMKDDSVFYIRHKYCTRGRTYSGSYHLNPQGASFKKAVVQLSYKEVVTGV